MRRIPSALVSLLAAAALVACGDAITSPIQPEVPSEVQTDESCDDSDSDCFGGTQGSNG